VLDQVEIETRVVNVLQQTVADWDVELPDGITSATRLMQDLNFESIDVVQFAVGLEQEFGQRGLPFEKLFMQDGQYVEDVTVSEIAHFVRAELPAGR